MPISEAVTVLVRWSHRCHGNHCLSCVRQSLPPTAGRRSRRLWIHADGRFILLSPAMLPLLWFGIFFVPTHPQASSDRAIRAAAAFIALELASFAVINYDGWRPRVRTGPLVRSKCLSWAAWSWRHCRDGTPLPMKMYWDIWLSANTRGGRLCPSGRSTGANLLKLS